MSVPIALMTAVEKQRILTVGPLGLWRTVAGSADSLMHAAVCFRANGTGDVVSQSVLSGPEEMTFYWAMRGPGALALRDAETADGLDAWEQRQLAFRIEHTDLGDFEVLGEDGGDGFWFLLSPLGFVGTDTPSAPASAPDP